MNEIFDREEWELIGKYLMIIFHVGVIVVLIFQVIVVPDTRFVWLIVGIVFLCICIILFFAVWFPKYLDKKQQERTKELNK